MSVPAGGTITPAKLADDDLDGTQRYNASWTSNVTGKTSGYQIVIEPDGSVRYEYSYGGGSLPENSSGNVTLPDVTIVSTSQQPIIDFTSTNLSGSKGTGASKPTGASGPTQLNVASNSTGSGQASSTGDSTGSSTSTGISQASATGTTTTTGVATGTSTGTSVGTSVGTTTSTTPSVSGGVTTGTTTGTGTTTSIGTGTGKTTSSGTGTSSQTGSGSGTTSGTGTGTNTGTGTSSGTGTGTKSGTDTGTGTDTSSGTGTGTTTGTGTGTKSGTSTGTDTGTGTATSTGTGTNTGTDTGTGTSTSSGTGTSSDTGTGTTTGTSIGTIKIPTSTSNSTNLGIGSSNIPSAIYGKDYPGIMENLLKSHLYESKFKNPLEKLQSLTKELKGSDAPMTSPISQTSPANSSFYTYGATPLSVDSILNGSSNNQETPVQGFKKGGYVAPLSVLGSIKRKDGRHDFRHGAHVAGEGDGQSDDIPAMLADGEFVFPADVVSALGNGSTKAGTDKLYKMMEEIRKKARSTKVDDLPPPALKSPLDYLKGRKK